MKNQALAGRVCLAHHAQHDNEVEQQRSGGHSGRAPGFGSKPGHSQSTDGLIIKMRLPIPSYFIALSLVLLMVSSRGADVTYSDAFRRHYPVRGREFVIERYELEEPTVVWNQHYRRKATIRRTRGDTYPYEDQKCVITVEGQGLKQERFLSLADFRTVQVSWVTGKLMLLEVGIGHVAGVEAIYDVEKDLWVYRESVQYARSVGSPASPPSRRRSGTPPRRRCSRAGAPAARTQSRAPGR